MFGTTSRRIAPLAALAVLTLAAAPATAAGPVAQASATALVVTVANTPNDSGSYQVTHDGDRETATGNNQPMVTAIGGQSVVTTGTLAQDATTSFVDRKGRSAACAGLAGDGATLVAAGDSLCLTPGNQVSLSAGNLDLSNLTIVESDLTMDLDEQLQEALDPLLDEVVPVVQTTLQQVLTELGDPGLFLNVGAIQSRCTAGPNTADGDSELADVGAFVQLPDRRIDLVRLPVHPPPNTKLLTDLDEVVVAVTDAVGTQLETGLDGVLAPAGPLVDELEAALVTAVIGALGDQLGPLEENVLDGTLNRQVRPTPDSIEVTALALSVLPAAREMGVDLVSIEIGKSTCGPSGRLAIPDAPRPPPADVPTSVPAGLSEAPSEPGGSGNDLAAAGALAALLVLSAGAGVFAYRRRLYG